MTEELTRRRALQMTAAASGTSLFAGSAATAARKNLAGEYAYDLPDIEGGMIAISSDGDNVLVYLCDGNTAHPPTMEHWLRGPISGGLVQLDANNVAVVARLTPEAAYGSVRLKDGSLHQFIAPAIAPSASGAGLFRGTQTFNGVPYVAGWIALPGSEERRVEERRDIAGIEPAAFVVPMQADHGTATPVASRTGPGFPNLPHTLPRTGGCVVNQQTGSILPYVAPNFSTLKAEVPGLGTFELHRCLKTVCT